VAAPWAARILRVGPSLPAGTDASPITSVASRVMAAWAPGSGWSAATVTEAPKP
jgi:hypothetical protein